MASIYITSKSDEQFQEMVSFVFSIIYDVDIYILVCVNHPCEHTRFFLVLGY